MPVWAKGAKFSPMAHVISLPASMHQRLSRAPARTMVVTAIAVLIAVLAGRAIWAQVAGDRGIAPIASSRDINVGGIKVDVRGATAEEAQQAGWVLAERLAWKKLGGPAMSDSQIDAMVASVVIEQEKISPHRYIATLGITFDRSRAGGLLGAGGEQTRSAPMLLIPVTFEGGTRRVYEMVNPWQRAWAEFQPGTSRIDYVRPSGSNGDSLLVTYGQVGRRSRTWWRNILDQFAAADVLVPIAHLEHQWPGGPIKGTFTARYGPDDKFLASFSMTSPDDAGLAAMLQQAVVRFDTIFQQAMADGKLRPDPTLNLGTPTLDPALQRLLDLGRAAEAREKAQQAQDSLDALPVDGAAAPTPSAPAAPAVVNSYTVQFPSPDGAAVDAALAAMRSVPGVRGAATSSLAFGGTSVMRVSFAGSLDQLAGELRGRGYKVTQGSNALSISR